MHGLFCAFTFLLAELIARPWAEMGISDDWSYVRTVQVLSQTGHIVYNGWATAMLGWQLLPAAVFIRLFGFSFTSIRMSTLLFAVITTFLIQRIFVRSGISERNSNLGTLAITLSPIYMKISATFMTDIQGLFGVVLCLYCCIRGLQTLNDNAAAGWLVSAAISNSIIGSARQVAWLGLLVMVPCTLWLLRRRRRILWLTLPGEALGLLFMLFCLWWFKHQPYTLSEPILVPIHGLRGVLYMARQLGRAALEVFFLLLALTIAFLPEIRRWSKLRIAAVAVFLVGYTLLALRIARRLPGSMLEPVLGDWIGPHAWYEEIGLVSNGPVILHIPERVILTLVATLATICIGTFLLRLRHLPALARPAARGPVRQVLSWHQVCVLILPFIAAYFALLIPRSVGNLWDRYLLELNVVFALLLIRLYQDYIQPSLPTFTIVAIALIALFSIASTNDMYALYRARVVLNDEAAAHGIPRNDFDGGAEYNAYIQILTSGYINEPRLAVPAGIFNPNVDPYRGGICDSSKSYEHAVWPDYDPGYGISFSPDDCGGPAGLAPASFFRWLGLKSQPLYIVRYRPNPLSRTPFK